MQIRELIALAKTRSGKTQEEMGQEMGHSGKTRLSKIASGDLAANPSEIRYLAIRANMDPTQVQGEIEAEKHPALAWVWETSHALYLGTVFPGPTGGAKQRRRKTRCNHALGNRLSNPKHRTNRFNRVSTLNE